MKTLTWKVVSVPMLALVALFAYYALPHHPVPASSLPHPESYNLSQPTAVVASVSQDSAKISVAQASYPPAKPEDFKNGVHGSWKFAAASGVLLTGTCDPNDNMYTLTWIRPNGSNDWIDLGWNCNIPMNSATLKWLLQQLLKQIGGFVDDLSIVKPVIEVFIQGL